MQNSVLSDYMSKMLDTVLYSLRTSLFFYGICIYEHFNRFRLSNVKMRQK